MASKMYLNLNEGVPTARNLYTHALYHSLSLSYVTPTFSKSWWMSVFADRPPRESLSKSHRRISLMNLSLLHLFNFLECFTRWPVDFRATAVLSGGFSTICVTLYSGFLLPSRSFFVEPSQTHASRLNLLKIQHNEGRTIVQPEKHGAFIFTHFFKTACNIL